MRDEAAATNALTGEAVSDSALKHIAELAEDQLRLESQIREQETILQELNDQLAKVRDIQLPDAMTEVGMESFKLQDGSAIIIQPFYQGKIPEDRTVEAFAWLREHNFDSIIKRNILCTFGKGQDANAERVAQILKLQKIDFADKSSVHPQTMKAFIREQIEGGHTLPTDLLGVYVGKRAKVTPAK